MKLYKPIIFTAVSVLLASVALAKLPDPTPLQQAPNNMILLNQNALKTAACNALQNKIEAKIKNYDTNKGKHAETYTKLIDRLTQKIADWIAAGYDTDQVEEDLKVLNDKVKQFANDYATLVTKLKALETVSCDTATEFNATLQAVRDALKSVRTDVSAIRQYYWSTLRPDIIKLKQQNPVVEEE